MKIRVVSSRDEIFTLNPNERVVHLAFRPSGKDVLRLVETCPKIEVIQLSNSYKRTVSTFIQMFLENERIQLIEGEIWGHRKDLNEYYIIPSSVTEKIKEMKSEGVVAKEIEARVSSQRKLNPEMIAYIISKETPAQEASPE